MQSDRANERHILFVGLLSEGLLLAFALGWISLRELQITLELTPFDMYFSGLLALPLVIINFGFMRFSQRRHPNGTVEKFRREILHPIAQELSPSGALIISLSAGMAEEALFRGALFQELLFFGVYPAVVLSSAIFAYVHFIGQVRNYWPLLPIYFLMGVILCLLVLQQENLTGAIVLHTVYNFFAILLLKSLATNDVSQNRDSSEP